MPRHLQVDLDFLTLKVVSESRVTWSTSVPILVFLGLSVLDLAPMYATDRRQTESDAHNHLMSPPYGGGDIIITGSAPYGSSAPGPMCKVNEMHEF